MWAFICIEDNTIRLNDGAIKIFLNVNSDMNDIDEELANFLNYLKTGIPEDNFTKELDESVKFARTSKEWKEEYRMIDMQRRIWKQDGRAEGIHMVIEGMIKENIPVDVICRVANVTPAEVEAIKASMMNEKACK